MKGLCCIHHYAQDESKDDVAYTITLGINIVYNQGSSQITSIKSTHFSSLVGSLEDY
jgi:hypothetical protein